MQNVLKRKIMYFYEKICNAFPNYHFTFMAMGDRFLESRQSSQQSPIQIDSNQIDRQIDRWIYRQIGRCEIDSWRVDRAASSHRSRQIQIRQIDRQIDIQIDIQIDRQVGDRFLESRQSSQQSPIQIDRQMGDTQRSIFIDYIDYYID